MTDRFRLLSLDGGGIRGAFAASVLARLEKRLGLRTVDHFDLITGTSTGGIIAIGLALGLPASKILEFYRHHGPEIFPGTGLAQRWMTRLRQLARPSRSLERLRRALEEVFEQRVLGEARCRLVLPTYDAVAGRIYLLKTAHSPHVDSAANARAVDCALATAAAPTFFEAASFPTHPGASYLDGGVWANSPVLVGLVEAVHFLEVPLDRIQILSIGTVEEPFSVSRKRRRGGALAWNVGIIQLLMRGQAEAALAMAQLLTGGAVHRIDAIAAPGRFSLDDVRAIGDLITLGDGEARKKEHLAVVSSRFLDGDPAGAFTPTTAGVREEGLP